MRPPSTSRHGGSSRSGDSCCLVLSAADSSQVSTHQTGFSTQQQLWLPSQDCPCSHSVDKALVWGMQTSAVTINFLSWPVILCRPKLSATRRQTEPGALLLVICQQTRLCEVCIVFCGYIYLSHFACGEKAFITNSISWSQMLVIQSEQKFLFFSRKHSQIQ